MTEETKELLLDCKKAGYEIVTVLVRDERVPLSMELHAGSRFGHETLQSPIKVICGFPERLGKDTNYTHGESWPLIWGIIRKFSLGGSGCGDSFDIHPDLIETLTPGCYELKDIA